MDEIERALRAQIVDGPGAASVPPEEAVEAAAERRLVRLLLALSDDAALHAEWARSVEFGEQDRFGRAAWLRAEIERVDRGIDERLDSGEVREIVELLARCEIPWRHEAIEGALADDELRAAASMVVADATPGALRRALMECEVVDDVVEMLRAAAVRGADQLWDQFLIWRDRVEELEEVDEREQAAWLQRIDGAGAVLDPTLYARGLLSGEYGTAWLAEPTAVADFLQVYGPSDWLEVVSAMELAADDAFEMASTLAAAAAHGIGGEPPDDEEVRRLLDLLGERPRPNQKESPWEQMAARAGYGFEMALAGEEEEFGLLLAQTAAHERLVTHGIHSPGIRGLPLSATAEEDLDEESVRELIGDMAAGAAENEALRVSAVRTLFDAGVWARRGAEQHEALMGEVARAFVQTGDRAVELARDRLADVLDPGSGLGESAPSEGASTLQEALVSSAASAGTKSGADRRALIEALSEAASDRESPLGLDCLRHLGEVAGTESLEMLGRLWLCDAPPMRAPFVRRLLEESIEVGLEESS